MVPGTRILFLKNFPSIIVIIINSKLTQAANADANKESNLKTGAAVSYETFEHLYQPSQCHILEDSKCHTQAVPWLRPCHGSSG